MPSRPLKASRTVTITALAAISLTFAAACGNGNTVTADCVVKQPDGSYKAVDDDYCDDHHHGGGGTFVWIYGGSHGSNGRITGGSITRPPNTNISSRAGRVIVGGFGGSAKGGSGS